MGFEEFHLQWVVMEVWVLMVKKKIRVLECGGCACRSYNGYGGLGFDGEEDEFLNVVGVRVEAIITWFGF
ncbi:hypothetical protein HanRHA438_Chr16g0740181 [Helianthus annuus]|nr:hypothetical protein HanRHA438_Chr16g0740181 [Helianthus annuus]